MKWSLLAAVKTFGAGAMAPPREQLARGCKAVPVGEQLGPVCKAVPAGKQLAPGCKAVPAGEQLDPVCKAVPAGERLDPACKAVPAGERLDPACKAAPAGEQLGPVCKAVPAGEQLARVCKAWARFSSSEAGPVTVFHCRFPPSITVEAYFKRIVARCRIEVPVAVCAFIYIDRVYRSGRCSPNALTFHRVMAASMWLSLCYLEDQPPSLDVYGMAAGLSLKEMARLVRFALEVLEWQVFVSKEEWYAYSSLIFSADVLGSVCGT